MKFRIPYARVGSLEFVNNPGNGSAVPVYYLDQKEMVIKKKLNKSGEHVTRSLYEEIQMFAGANDYKKIIAQNGNSTSGLNLGSQTDSHVDLTQFGNASDLMNAQVRLNQSGISYETILKKFNELLNKQKDSVKSDNQNLVSEVKENEIKK